MTRSIALTPVTPQNKAQALAWLSENAKLVLGSELLLRQIPTPSGANSLIAWVDSKVVGVSVWFPRSVWFLQATDAAVAHELCGPVLRDAPKKLFCPMPVWSWLSDEVQRTRRLVRHHRALAMSCAGERIEPQGRWARLEDLERLRTYREQYDAERQIRGRLDTARDIHLRRVAVVEHDGQIVSVLRYGGDTARYSCIGGTYTFPEWRGRGFARRLVAFMVRALAARGKVAHLIVDDDNTSALAVYEAAGFDTLGEVFIAYLE